MDRNENVEYQIAQLQRRVGILAVACIGSWGVLAILAAVVILKMFVLPEVIRAHRLVADQIDSEILTANTVLVRSPEAVADTISLGGGRIALQDPAGDYQVLLNANGLRVGDVQGKHALFLGLNRGPGELSSPFLVMRDRTSEERLTLGLNAEDDWPYARLRGTENGQENSITAESIMLYGSNGRIVLRNSDSESPHIEVSGKTEGQLPQSTVITPSTNQQSPQDK